MDNITIESDLKILVNWCLKSSFPPWELYDLWKKVADLGESVSYTISHVYRETNATANSLAKLAASGVSSTYFGHTELPKVLLVNGPLTLLDCQTGGIQKNEKQEGEKRCNCGS